MKNIIIGLVIGLLLNGILVFAKENVTFNLATRIGTIDGYPVFTSKVATSEGTYRLFIYHPYKGGGITAVKIK